MPALPAIGVTPSAAVSRPLIEPPTKSAISTGAVSSLTAISTSRAAYPVAPADIVMRPLGTPSSTKEPPFSEDTAKL